VELVTVYGVIDRLLTAWRIHCDLRLDQNIWDGVATILWGCPVPVWHTEILRSRQVSLLVAALELIGGVYGILNENLLINSHVRSVPAQKHIRHMRAVASWWVGRWVTLDTIPVHHRQTVNALAVLDLRPIQLQ
jgi:hypothetical protein